MDNFDAEESVELLGKNPIDVDIEKDVNDDHKDGQGKWKRKLISQVWWTPIINPLFIFLLYQLVTTQIFLVNRLAV